MPRIRTSSTLARVPGWPGGRQMRGSFWSQPELHRHVVVGVCRGCRSFTAGPKRHLASVRSVEYVIFDSWGRSGFHSLLTKRSKGADAGRAPLRALNSSRPDVIREQRRTARCKSWRSGRAGCPGSSVGIEFETLLRMTVSSLLRPCAAAAAMAHTRSVFNRRSTPQSSWAVVTFWVAGRGWGFGIKEMEVEK